MSEIPEREFRIWRAYRLKRRFPSRSNELYLAQVALKIAQSMGADGVSLNDFLFDPPEDNETIEDIDIDAMRKGMID